MERKESIWMMTESVYISNLSAFSPLLHGDELEMPPFLLKLQ